MTFQKVYIFNHRNLPPDSDFPNDFNFFSFSKIYYDDQIKSYVANIAKDIKFYDPLLGKTFYTDSKDNKLLMKNDPLKKYKLQGYISGSNTNFNKCLCNISFFFLPGILKEVKDQTSSELLKYAKHYNLCLRKKNPNFPTPQEIDDLLKNDCSMVCKQLYKLIKD